MLLMIRVIIAFVIKYRGTMFLSSKNHIASTQYIATVTRLYIRLRINVAILISKRQYRFKRISVTKKKTAITNKSWLSSNAWAILKLVISFTK